MTRNVTSPIFGGVARQVLISLDDTVRRPAAFVTNSPLGFTHHNAPAQVFADDEGARFVWITDLFPDELAASTAEPGGARDCRH